MPRNFLRENLCAKLLSAAAIAGVCGACSSPVPPSLTTIDIAAYVEVPDKGTLDEIFEFASMIRPEATDTTLLSYVNVRGLVANRIYVQEDNRLMTFDATDGRCIASFDHTGDAADEYRMLGIAFVSPENGDWVAYDTHGKKIVRYTVSGNFVGAYPANIEYLSSDGDKWVAQKKVAEGENEIIYIYDDNFNLTDSIATGITHYNMEPHAFDTFDGYPAMKASDTLYTITPDNTLLPTVAFHLGSYLMPHYRQEEFHKMMSERYKHLTFEFYGAAGLGALNYRFNEKVMLQFYSLSDGTLIFSDSQFPAYFKGFPFTIDGKEMYVVPTGEPTADSFFFMITSSQFEDTEDNPAILRLKIKYPYSTPYLNSITATDNPN